MSDIYLESITYYKTEIDGMLEDEAQRVDTALNLKVNTNLLGSPGGVSTLDGSGKHPIIETPTASTIESSDSTNTETVITPQTLHYQLDIMQTTIDALEARIWALENP